MDKISILRNYQKLKHIYPKWCFEANKCQLPFALKRKTFSTNSSNTPNNESASLNSATPSETKQETAESCVNKTENEDLFPPLVPNDDDCCKEGCQNCIWIEYVISVKFHYNLDKEKIREAIECIPSPTVRTFVELEMKNFMKKEPKVSYHKQEL